MFFHPDATIFPRIEFDAETIAQRLEVASYLHRGLKITFDNEVSRRKVTYAHAEGLGAYLRTLVTERGTRPVHEAPFLVSRDGALRLDLALQWTESTDEHLRSYVNGIPTGSGGTHENGFRAGARARRCATSSRRTTSRHAASP